MDAHETANLEKNQDYVLQRTDTYLLATYPQKPRLLLSFRRLSFQSDYRLTSLAMPGKAW